MSSGRLALFAAALCLSAYAVVAAAWPIPLFIACVIVVRHSERLQCAAAVEFQSAHLRDITFHYHSLHHFPA